MITYSQSYTIKLALTIIIGFALLGSLHKTIDQSAFISFLFLFIAPLAYDNYVSHPVTKINITKKTIVAWISYIFIMLILIVNFSGFNFSKILFYQTNFLGPEVSVSFLIGLVIVMLYILFAVIDFVVYRSPEEESHLQEIRELHIARNTNMTIGQKKAEYDDMNKEVAAASVVQEE